MTLGELKQMVLKLLDEKPHKNLAERFHTFFNIGQFEVATTCGYIYKQMEIVHIGGEQRYSMPEDFYVMVEVTYAEYDGHAPIRVQVNWKGGNTVVLEKPGRYQVYYRAYPTPITDKTEDDFSMELPIEAQLALPFYVAAQICATDEREKYGCFLQQYQNKLLNMMAQDRENKTISVNLRGAIYGI